MDDAVLADLPMPDHLVKAADANGDGEQMSLVRRN